jgi:hypothetical protein
MNNRIAQQAVMTRSTLIYIVGGHFCKRPTFLVIEMPEAEVTQFSLLNAGHPFLLTSLFEYC